VAARAERPAALLESARDGDRGALARLLSTVERGGADARDVARLVAGRGGRAYVVGITGAPGAGKSTLVSALVGVARAAGETVAVLAVDPSSPFTGGAILGDRVRMQDHSGDRGVYIRSMATRGHLGGLAVAAADAVRTLDAVGFDRVIVETVGVGQVEVEVARAADTTVVVVNPGWGDAVQANKAGLMEIADVFVINKADRPGADATRRDLEGMLELSEIPAGGWRPPVVATVATTGDGAAEAWRVIGAHRETTLASGALGVRRASRAREELREIVVRRLEARARATCEGADWERLAGEVAAGRTDAWTAADEMLRGIGA
jgi:LAO/AO transport system kinase